LHCACNIDLRAGRWGTTIEPLFAAPLHLPKGRIGQRRERKKVRAEGAKGLQSRQSVDEALYLVDSRQRSAPLRESLGIGCGCLVTLDDEASVLGCQRVCPLSFFLENRQRLLELGKDSRSSTRSEEGLCLLLCGAESIAQIGQSGGSGEQQMAEIALAGQDTLSAGLERLVVETKHGLICVAIETSELAHKQIVGNGITGFVQQTIIWKHDPGEATDPNRPVRMNAILSINLGRRHGAQGKR
jgi:hypothetical protein